MKFYGNAKETEAAIIRLIRSCDSMRWAVAWAYYDFPLFHVLTESKHKIQQLTVGIHFYQTHPDFIASFLDNSSVRFVMNPSGVFHPKLYFFRRRASWDCIIGSPNFTNGAFTSNAEAAIHVSNDDLNADDTLLQIENSLDAFHSNGRQLDQQALDSYREIWKRQQRRLNPLSGTYAAQESKRKPIGSPLDAQVFVANWPEYFGLVKEDSIHTTEGRLAVLEEAQRLFRQFPHFNDMSDDDRRGIAGFGKRKPLDWHWFGSMKGHPYFKPAVNQKNAQISEALDMIPLDGEVTQSQFGRYLMRIRNAFRNAHIGTITRLLTLKRPDYFVCLDQANIEGLRKDFKITERRIEPEDYWEKVTQRILDSNWWDSPEPSDPLQRRVWRCRAAFLDVLYYHPK
jgi:hypothetical protein